MQAQKPDNFIDLTGQRFGRLTAIEQTKSKNECTIWICRCECGNTKEVYYSNLVKGRTKSCGCYSKESHSKHARSRTTEYNTWILMKQRCENPKNTSYCHYGGRGISICERWRSSFENFLEDMGTKPSPKHSIDRIDVNGNYEPSNCRWVTSEVQGRNTRIHKTNTSGYRGIKKNESSGFWLVYITVYNQNKYIGTFKDLNDAIEARRSAELKYWGSIYATS